MCKKRCNCVHTCHQHNPAGLNAWCKAMQDERQAHQSITKEMNEKYEAACANHASSLRQAQEVCSTVSDYGMMSDKDWK